MHLETLCVLDREEIPAANASLVAPVHQTAVWTLESIEACEAVYAGERTGFIYTRDGNPNHTQLETCLAQLEGAAAGVVTATGMAALACACTAFTGAGGRIVAARQLYGASVAFLTGELGRYGVRTSWVDVTDLAQVEAACREGIDLLLVETVANPLLQIADLPRLAEIAHAAGGRLVVDNTFCSPTGCRPLSFGADVVFHSVTKFLSGHSDLTLGVVVGSEPDMAVVRRQSRLFGGAANPFEAWLARRGVCTLPLRMARSSENAQILAERLAGCSAVARVHYPGLPSHPQHELAARLLTSPGAMLSFDLGEARRARAFIRGLERIRFAPSLGDVATTVSFPAGTSHRALTPEERSELGITDGLVRLSAGIEHVNDLWADLSQALTASD